MKALALLSILLLVTTGSQAASKKWNRTSTKKDMSYSEVRKKLKGFSLVGYFSAANRLPIKFENVEVTAKSESAFGLGGEYKASLKQYSNNAPMSVISGVVYESPRELKALNVSGTQTGFDGISNPSFSMLLPYMNLGYNFTKEATFFGGMNFPVPFESDFGEVSLGGALGFQGGVSMEFTKSFAADVSYRWVNLTGNSGLNRIDVDGLQLKGRYIF